MKVSWLMPDGLRWECVRCGRCCMNLFDADFRSVAAYAEAVGGKFYGPETEPSNLPYIYIHEVKRITRQLNERFGLRMHLLDVFIPLIVAWEEKSRIIKDIFFTFKPTVPGKRYCSFFNPRTKLCAIYPIRPTACKLYPFFEGPPSYRTQKDEVVIMVDVACQGIGKGKPVDRTQILNLILQYRLQGKRSRKYWKRRRVSVKPQIRFMEETGRLPTPTEAAEILNLRKHVTCASTDKLRAARVGP